MLNKKADGGLTAIVIILIALVFIGWLVNLNSRECNSNKDCKKDSYCGSDFNCHEFPVIEKTSIITRVSFTFPILLICITAIAIAIIVRWEKIFNKKESQKEAKTKVETPETYYTSQVQYTAK